MQYDIEFLLYDSVLGLDVTGPLEVFYTANRLLSEKHNIEHGYTFHFSAEKAGCIQLSSGLTINADCEFDIKRHSDILFVPGGKFARDEKICEPIIDYIKAKNSRVQRIVSVCHGAFILASAGLLNKKRATTHWLAADELSNRFPEIDVDTDAIFIKDGNIYTSAGVTAGIDLALAIVEEDFGIELGIEVARVLVLYYHRPGTQSQFSSTLRSQQIAGKKFKKLYSWLVENIKESITVEDMADVSAMSERNFIRVFKKKTGLTPGKYLEMIRLDKAREVISIGNESLASIAEVSGFQREERLRRAFIRNFGLTPSQYRLHFDKTVQPEL